MFLISFIRTEWTIENYPIRVGFQPANKASDASRLKPIPWTASVINWPTMTPPVTHTYIQAIKQPTLHYLTRSVRRRAATS